MKAQIFNMLQTFCGKWGGGGNYAPVPTDTDYIKKQHTSTNSELNSELIHTENVVMFFYTPKCELKDGLNIQ